MSLLEYLDRTGKHKYTDEYLLTFETKRDLIKVTKNQGVINRWKELTGKSK